MALKAGLPQLAGRLIFILNAIVGLDQGAGFDERLRLIEERLTSIKPNGAGRSSRGPLMTRQALERRLSDVEARLRALRPAPSSLAEALAWTAWATDDELDWCEQLFSRMAH